MKIAFFGTKPYDRQHFHERMDDHTIEFLRPRLSPETAPLAKGFDAVCAFVNDDLSRDTIISLSHSGVKYVLMRCAGYNNVDLEAAKEFGITVARVPAYSPEAVAEHAMTLLMAANRRIHKAYNMVRDNNYSLVGLSGLNLYGKTAGIIGTGKIGQAMARICKGFGMTILAYDPYPNNDIVDELDVHYVPLYDLYAQADVISLHCPMTEKNHHMINRDSISYMKDGVILVNTSRGGLIDTKDLIKGIKKGKFHAVGLDVYEEENGLVFDDMSGTILEHTTTARLLSFPNVILTSHQGFLTSEALESIASVTIQNATDLKKGNTCENEVEYVREPICVCPHCGEPVMDEGDWGFDDEEHEPTCLNCGKIIDLPEGY